MKPKTNTFEIQNGKLNRPFKLTSTVKGKEEKWIGNTLKSDWYHVFKYIDDGSLFALHEDTSGKIFEKLNHEEISKKLTQ